MPGAQILAAGSFVAIGHSRTLAQQELDLANTFLMPPVPYDFGILSDSDGANSSFSTSFHIETVQPFRLTAAVALSAQERVGDTQGFELTAAAASVVLVGPSGTVGALAIDQSEFCDFFGPCSAGSDSLAAEGILEPGIYTLSASTSGGAQGTCTDIIGFACYAPSADGSFDASLSIGSHATLPSLSGTGFWLLVGLLGLLGRIRLRRT